jgi:hypothetical protein
MRRTARLDRVLRRFPRRRDESDSAHNGGRVLQVEPHGAVVVEDGETVVRKSFFGDDENTRRRIAATEFDRQSRFWRNLQGTDGISCPRPLELIDASRPQIRMEFARGQPISKHLRDVDLSSAELTWLADTLIRALASYVQSTDEPYYDFHLRNMLYDPVDRVVAFVDFGIPKRLEHSLDQLSGLSPFEISLGNLVAGTIFESARPRGFYRLRQHRQALRLCSAVLERALDGDGDLNIENVRRASDIAYGASVYWGPALRQGWYRLPGRLLARRLVVRRVVFGPCAT